MFPNVVVGNLCIIARPIFAFFSSFIEDQNLVDQFPLHRFLALGYALAPVEVSTELTPHHLQTNFSLVAKSWPRTYFRDFFF